MRRKLDEVEERISRKNLKSMQDELNYVENVELARIDFVLSVADLEFEHQKHELENKKRSIQMEVKEMKRQIDILNDQIENGVEIKDEKEDK